MPTERRLLMISPHFPPDSSAGTHRVRLLAPHLRSYGWSPTVLTVAEEDYESRLDPELASLVPSSLPVVRSRALSMRMTRTLGVGDLGLRALPGLRRTACRLLDREHFDAVFITIYPTYPAILGPMLKRRFKVPFVLDYQDPWVGSWGKTVGGGQHGAVDAKSRLTRALAAQLEPRVLGVADAVTAVSSRTYEEAIARTGCSPRIVAELPIGWDPRDIDALSERPASARLIPDDGRLNICYVGTLLPLGIEALRAVLKATRTLLDGRVSGADRIRFHFFGTSNQSGGGEPRAVAHARELGVDHLVSEHPARLDYLDALAVLRQADALLLLGSSEPHYTPSKVFPALLANRPILAVYHQDSTALGMIEQAMPPRDASVIAFEAQSIDRAVGSIAAALRELIDRTDGVVQANRLVLDQWSAPTLAGRLASVCDRIAA